MRVEKTPTLFVKKAIQRQSLLVLYIFAMEGQIAGMEEDRGGKESHSFEFSNCARTAMAAGLGFRSGCVDVVLL